jgi:hypothetical protein
MAGKRRKHRTATAAGAAAAAGVVVMAARSWARSRRGRGDVVVTLYSEPGYQGKSQRFSYDRKAYALGATRLGAVGSIRVQRLDCTFRRADAFRSLLWAAITDRENRGEAAGWLGLAALRALSPAAWRREHDPAGDRQSWVRLWAVRPVSSPSALDEHGSQQDEADAAAWCDFLEDTPDIGVWRERARYIEPSVRNPHAEGASALVPPGMRARDGMPLTVVGEHASARS